MVFSILFVGSVLACCFVETLDALRWCFYLRLGEGICFVSLLFAPIPTDGFRARLIVASRCKDRIGV